MKENPDAVWKPYLITDENGKVNSYVANQSAKYLVVRKGYEHPEVIMKITTALFDDARFLGDSTPEIDAYQADGVDITARPLVNNCDYSDAVFRTTQNIEQVFDGKKKQEELSSLEKVYYDLSVQYLSGKHVTPDVWAGYHSRITAVDLITQPNTNYVNQEYVQNVHYSTPQDLYNMEILSFMKIITGEEPITYFETFVREWQESGGTELTKKVQEAMDK
ncbi:MAG: hypothetical protein PHP50_08275 [Lachnospiraceae bacterium]|nr:hypothetical protein [Lachnospiraceae bacterium]